MVSVGEAGRMAMGLPQVAEGERRGHRTWSVSGKAFAWERPFSKADIRRFGDATPPDGPILAVRVADLGEKEAVLAAQPKAFFTIPHFDGYSAVLIQLQAVTKRALREAIVDGWLACAPPSVATEYLKQEPDRGRVLLIDAANVVGSRPTGWWRDRAKAAHEFVAQVRAASASSKLSPPVVVVLEGVARRGADEGVIDGVEVVHASGQGDDALVALAAAASEPVVLVSADRALAQRCRAVGSDVVGPSWLLERLIP